MTNLFVELVLQQHLWHSSSHKMQINYL